MIIIIANKTAATINVGKTVKNNAANNAPKINPKSNANKNAKKQIMLLEHQQNVELRFLNRANIISPPFFSYFIIF